MALVSCKRFQDLILLCSDRAFQISDMFSVEYYSYHPQQLYLQIFGYRSCLGRIMLTDLLLVIAVLPLIFGCQYQSLQEQFTCSMKLGQHVTCPSALTKYSKHRSDKRKLSTVSLRLSSQIFSSSSTCDDRMPRSISFSTGSR